MKTSADRLCRVMNMPEDGSNSSSASSAIDVDHGGVVVQANLDPMLALVHAGPFVTIAIIVPMSFTGGDGTTGLLELPIEELDEALCTVHGQVLVLKKVDSSTVAANAGSFCGIVTVSGSVTSVVNPATAVVPDGTWHDDHVLVRHRDSADGCGRALGAAQDAIGLDADALARPQVDDRASLHELR